MATTRDILIAAKARIGVPKRWCKGAFAKEGGVQFTRIGVDVMPAISRCNCFCVIGALYAELYEQGYYHSRITETFGVRHQPAHALLQVALNQKDGFFGSALDTFNDKPEVTHEDILALYDDAIFMAEAG